MDLVVFSESLHSQKKYSKQASFIFQRWSYQWVTSLGPNFQRETEDSASEFLVGGFFPPIWKICSSNWIISPGRGETKKCLKPPSRFALTNTEEPVVFTNNIAKINTTCAYNCTFFFRGYPDSDHHDHVDDCDPNQNLNWTTFCPRETTKF